ncbi:glycoside hydrolase family 19 protein [Vreelandella populi]|nr:glycoside hydrolase family 19 protein [Halomonas populi]
MPRCPEPETWARAFDDAIERFGIENVPLLLAQVGHESADLTQLEENLSYTAERIAQVWPSRFPSAASAQPFARNPEALANSVYANRMGNREPGDGWRFRGRGAIQLTGRYNYTRFANAISDRSILQMPDQLLQPKFAALSACWFYANHVPSGADVLLATQRINGGQHGLIDRQNRYDRALTILA